jgi:hypothetical protein
MAIYRYLETFIYSIYIIIKNVLVLHVLFSSNLKSDMYTPNLSFVGYATIVGNQEIATAVIAESDGKGEWKIS